MSAVYEAIGRVVVTFVRVRYRRQLRLAAALAVVAAAALGAYLSAREAEEG
jgi:hypothetical protein